MHTPTVKNKAEVGVMQVGGAKLAKVKSRLRKMVKAGVSAAEIEAEAVKLIKDAGGEPSFMLVPSYSWATCVNVNEGLVHGIPKAEIIFKKGDVVSVDLGMYYEGFHTDTSFTVGIEPASQTAEFLRVGEMALNAAIAAAKPGNRIFDISAAIEEVVKKGGYQPILALTGHGVGRELHEEPKIPCFVMEKRAKSPEIVPGMALAIEVMYTQGRPEIELAPDGWTIRTRDGKIAALFEETVAITKHGPLVLTEG